MIAICFGKRGASHKSVLYNLRSELCEVILARNGKETQAAGEGGDGIIVQVRHLSSILCDISAISLDKMP